MDERCVQVLNKIMSANRPLKISELSQIFNVSARTIRYDLDEIDDFLKDNDIPQLTRKPNSGIEFSLSHNQKQGILKQFDRISSYNYVLTPKEREKMILTELFQTEGYATIDEMANLLSVSRGTVVNNLESVRKWLIQHELKLESLPHYGIRVRGRERDMRRAVISLLSENMDLEKALNLIKTPIKSRINIVTDKQLKKLFQDLNMHPIEKYIRIAEEQLKTVFTDSAYSGLVIYFALAMKRIQLGKKIIMSEDELSKLKPTKEFAVASSIAIQLEENYNTIIPTDEIGYITIHLLSAKVTEIDTFSNQDWMRLHILTDEIIKGIQRKLDVDFSADAELYNGLIKHLEPTIYRLKHRLLLKNPIIQEIRCSYPNIFDTVKDSIKPLEEYIGSKVPDEEIGFITIHIGAALERNKTEDNNIYKAVVVCGTGVGTAKLLSLKMKNKFTNIDVLDTIASRYLEEFNKNNELDLIISTVPVICKNVPHIIVNPLLLEEDVAKIYKFLSTNPPRSSKHNKIQTTTQCLLKIIEKNCVIKDCDNLLKDISALLNLRTHNNLKEVAQPVLKDLLTKKTIELNTKASDWEEAVRIGGELLVKNGFVEPCYVEAMINNVKEIGPYIVVAPGIAMPHARPEDGVKKVSMSLVTLKEPVNFGLNGKDPVSVVIAIAALDNHTHINALSQLSDFLDNDRNISKLLRARIVEEVLELL